MRKIDLPGTKVCELKHGQTDAFAGGAAPGNLPQWLVLNFMLPSYDPPNPVWGKDKPDGDGFAFVMYFKMEDWVERELESRGTMATSVRFLSTWMKNRADGKDSLGHRLKAIPRVDNPEQVDFSWSAKKAVNSYSEKPFLTGPRCHRFYAGFNYLEVDVDFHTYTYVVREGIFSMLDKIGLTVLSIGIVLEGQKSDELPEQLLGSIRFTIPKVRNLPTLASVRANQQSSAPLTGAEVIASILEPTQQLAEESTPNNHENSSNEAAVAPGAVVLSSELTAGEVSSTGVSIESNVSNESVLAAAVTEAVEEKGLSQVESNN